MGWPTFYYRAQCTRMWSPTVKWSQQSISLSDLLNCVYKVRICTRTNYGNFCLNERYHHLNACYFGSLSEHSCNTYALMAQSILATLLLVKLCVVMPINWQNLTIKFCKWGDNAINKYKRNYRDHVRLTSNKFSSEKIYTKPDNHKFE